MPHFRHFRNPAGPEVHLEETKRDTALFHCTRGLTLNEGAHPQWDVQEMLGSDQTERMEDRAWVAAMVIYSLYHTCSFDDDQMLLSCAASCQRLLVLFIRGPCFIFACIFVHKFIFHDCVQLSAFIRQRGNLAWNAKCLGMPQEVIISY